MSVMGLTWSLTHLLTCTRSVQAFGENTTSRASDGLVWHSGLYSTQNCTQPIGARATSPTVMKAAGSAALAVAAGAATVAAHTSIRAHVPCRTPLKPLPIL